MINSLHLLRNIGRFDSVTAGANLPLGQLTLLYAENGRGKTTLAAILRSLATGDPLPINERRRLAAQHPPHVVVSCTGGPPNAMFQNGAWNRTLSDMVIFDDVFVDQNVYSGLVVGSDHRQKLHELIVGAPGVALNQQLQALIAQIEVHNAELRQRAAAIPTSERGNLSVDDFCALVPVQNVDRAIEVAEQQLAAAQKQDAIRNASEFFQLGLAGIDLPLIEAVLGAGLDELDAAAAAQVQEHFRLIGDDSERWVAEGMEKQRALLETGGNSCVFCAQDLSGSSLIEHYRAYFGQAYRDHQQRIHSAGFQFYQAHPSSDWLLFERSG